MRNVVIFGIGQIAEVVHYYLAHEANRNVAAFTVDDQYRSTMRLSWGRRRR
jgi:saccharopine dehydrogenase-like NADP-dependent oxidoreductase